MSSRSRQCTVAVVVMLCCCTAISMAASKWITIGEWQDFQSDYWKQTITILKSDGTYVLKCSFTDGSEVQSHLLPIKARQGERQRFRNTDSDYKEEYAILSSGDLALFDQEGFIRKAKKK